MSGQCQPKSSALQNHSHITASGQGYTRVPGGPQESEGSLWKPWTLLTSSVNFGNWTSLPLCFSECKRWWMFTVHYPKPELEVLQSPVLFRFQYMYMYHIKCIHNTYIIYSLYMYYSQVYCESVIKHIKGPISLNRINSLSQVLPSNKFIRSSFSYKLVMK
jgi:hypothetical protein